MRKQFIIYGNTRRLISAAFMLCLLFSLFNQAAYAQNKAASRSVELSEYSERYLSDLAISDGGNVSLDSEGNILYSIKSPGNSLRFKCTGASSRGRENALCIKLENNSPTNKLSVKIDFMDEKGKQYSSVYEKSASNSGNDTYIFIESPQNLDVAEITLKATGVGNGSLKIKGIWHCYYYFGKDNSSTNVGSINKLEFSDNGKKVTVSGSIQHDITISSANSKIQLYRLLPGEKINRDFISTHTPCAERLMSRSFSFTVENNTVEEYASSYAIVILSESGEIEYLLEDKRYPSVDYVHSDCETKFKGVASHLEFLASRTYSDTLIIDIDTSSFLKDTMNGYLYPLYGSNYCFDRNAVDIIDRRIASLSQNGKNVYFRLTHDQSTTAAGKNALYDADNEKAEKLYALLSFLCDRYSESLGGIIIGDKFDLTHTYSNLSSVSNEEYLRKYSDFICVSSCAVRNSLPDAKIIIPVSSNNSRSYGNSSSAASYPASAMMLSLLEMYSQSNEANLTFMICDSSFALPEDIKNLLSNSSSESNAGRGVANITSNNTETFDELLAVIYEQFKFTDKKYFFSWEPTGSHTSEEYKIAYAFNYFNLCKNKYLYSFICDFSKDEIRGSYVKSEHLTEIMTVMGSGSAKNYANMLTIGAADFTFEGIYGYDEYSAENTNTVKVNASLSLPENIIGKYSLSNPNTLSSLSGWKVSAYSEYLSLVSVSENQKAIKASMLLPDYSSEFAEIIYSLEKPIDISPINNLVIKMMINTTTSKQSSGYTVRVVVGGANVKCVSEIKTDDDGTDGKEFIISIDLLESKELTQIEYIKISVQNNSGTVDEIITNILSVDLCSKTHKDSQLKALYESSSGNINGPGNLNSSLKSNALVIIIILLLAIISITCVWAFSSFSEDEKKK